MDPNKISDSTQPLDQLNPSAKSTSWFSRIKQSLSKTSNKLRESITYIFSKNSVDEESLKNLEDALIMADVGPVVAQRMCHALLKFKGKKLDHSSVIQEVLRSEILKLIDIPRPHFDLTISQRPTTILVAGVNGSGKTTTLGKLAHHFTQMGYKVLLVAGDTFRAAAVEQLDIWAKRVGCRFLSAKMGADPAGLAFDAVQLAQNQGIDIVLIDTAGRLHTKTDLMSSFEKMIRVLKKIQPDAPHHCWMVLDATLGQNTLQQVEEFKKYLPLHALIFSKMDGSAKAGTLLALTEKFHLPVYALGMGEGIHDLVPFDPNVFVDALFGS